MTKEILPIQSRDHSRKISSHLITIVSSFKAYYYWNLIEEYTLMTNILINQFPLSTAPPCTNMAAFNHSGWDLYCTNSSGDQRNFTPH